jgi:hypothetical protein
MPPLAAVMPPVPLMQPQNLTATNWRKPAQLPSLMPVKPAATTPWSNCRYQPLILNITQPWIKVSQRN